MPYSGISDPDLPPGVQKLGKHQREIWVAAFNSAAAQKPNNEQYAFAVAWAAAQGGKAKLRMKKA